MSNPINELQKIGSAKLEMFFFDIYYSELYNQEGSYVPDTYPIALHIQYLRDIKADSLIERTEKEWKKLDYSKAQIAKWTPALSQLWPDINDQDTLTLVLESETQNAFYFNDKLIGSVEDPEFGQSFLAIWLDERCSYPKLRKQLIGEK